MSSATAFGLKPNASIRQRLATRLEGPVARGDRVLLAGGLSRSGRRSGQDDSDLVPRKRPLVEIRTAP